MENWWVYRKAVAVAVAEAWPVNEKARTEARAVYAKAVAEARAVYGR